MRIHLTRRVKRIIAIPLYFILAGGIDLAICTVVHDLVWLATAEGVVDTFIFMAIFSFLWQEKLPKPTRFNEQQMLKFHIWMAHVKRIRLGDPITSDHIAEWQAWEEGRKYSQKTSLTPIDN